MSWITEVFTAIENNNHIDGDDKSPSLLNIVDDNNENNVLNNFEKFSLHSRAGPIRQSGGKGFSDVRQW